MAARRRQSTPAPRPPSPGLLGGERPRAQPAPAGGTRGPGRGCGCGAPPPPGFLSSLGPPGPLGAPGAGSAPPLERRGAQPQAATPHVRVVTGAVKPAPRGPPEAASPGRGPSRNRGPGCVLGVLSPCGAPPGLGGPYPPHGAPWRQENKRGSRCRETPGKKAAECGAGRADAALALPIPAGQADALHKSLSSAFPPTA